MRARGDPVAGKGTLNAQAKPSVYGPLATASEWAAAELGGTSISRIIFWLKVEFALAYGAVAVALHRLLRSDAAAQVRAHLLWSVNPLMLWAQLAGAHVDVLAAAFCFFGLVVTRSATSAGSRVGVARALAAGALVGVGADIKINYVIVGLGARHPARASCRPGMAVYLAVAASLVRRDGVLPAGSLRGVPARLAHPRPLGSHDPGCDNERRPCVQAPSLYQLSTEMLSPVTSSIRLAAVAALVMLCATGAWGVPGAVAVSASHQGP